MKRLMALMLVFSFFPVSMAFSEGRGVGGSFGGGGGGFSGGDRGGGGDFSGSGNVSANSSGGYGARANNAGSNGFGTRSLGSSYYWGSRRSFSAGRSQNNFNRSHGYSLSNRNFSTRGNSSSYIGGNPNRYTASSVVPSGLRSMGVRTMPHSVLNTQMPGATGHFPQLVSPRTGPRGSVLHASVVNPRSNSSFVQSHMSSLANNGSLRSQVYGFNRSENRAGKYYWHNWNGSDYCHYRDFYGCNWWGCYDGGNCFWSCYYGDNWWWYDGGYDRWCYWDNDYWWWQDPGDVNQTYVYDDGDYVSADNSEAGSSDGVETNRASQGVYQSKDGTRKVEIVGDNQDAFLFDENTPAAFKPVYLSSGVKDVSFSSPQNGQPMQIAVVLTDGSFDLFDGQGRPAQQIFRAGKVKDAEN